jgi:hypothetical protein
MPVRSWVVWLSLLSAPGCAAQTIARETRVGIRARAGDSDSAVAVIHDSTACSVTLRDSSGTVHDRLIAGGESAPIDMERALSSAEIRVPVWRYPAPLLTTLAMPPGRYTVVAYETTDEFEDTDRAVDGLVRGVDCTGSLEQKSVRLPFRVEVGRVTLLHLPTGKLDFSTLAMTHAVEREPFVVEKFASWLPHIRNERDRTRRALTESLKSPRDGYDVYPNCDGFTAVVRKKGTPFNWYENPNDEIARRQFRYRVRAPIRSAHATGFGRGCVEPLAFIYILSDPSALEDAVRSVGELMKREDLAGEIDLFVRPMPVPH